MKPRHVRTTSRTIHLIVALVIGTYVYAPDHVTDGMRPLMMFAVIPLATLTGLFMWRQAAIRSFLAGSRRDRAVAGR